jgi:hypothetical protein
MMLKTMTSKTTLTEHAGNTMNFICPSCAFKDKLLSAGVSDRFMTFKCSSCGAMCHISPLRILRNAIFIMVTMIIIWMIYLPLLWLTVGVALKLKLFVLPLVSAAILVLFCVKYSPAFVLTQNALGGVPALYAGLAYGCYAYVIIQSIYAPLCLLVLIMQGQHSAALFVLVAPLVVVPFGVIVLMFHRLIWNISIRMWHC